MTTKTLDAIILSRKNYGEADRILTVFSKEEGKIKVIAKGCRKIKSKLACHIEPFSVGQYFVVEGKSFYILAGAEGIIPNNKISENIEVYKDASYICEILQLASEENEPNKTLYELTREVMAILPSLSNIERDIAARYFEFKILSESGYSPNYYHCLKCRKQVKESEDYTGNFEGVYCEGCKGEGTRIDIGTLKVLRLFERVNLGAILRIKNITDYNARLYEVTYSYLRDILPKTPKSKEL